MVSIRMPSTLLLELKSLAKKKHFLDLSEQIRSIARNKWLELTNPELHELKKLREEIQKQVKEKSMVKVRENVNKELEKIRQQLKKEDLLR